MILFFNLPLNFLRYFCDWLNRMGSANPDVLALFKFFEIKGCSILMVVVVGHMLSKVSF